ncbi:hypothetical protein VNO78_16061 [Psophocarpus tetragonolobus]|uniref:TF-B3 domain-containing protein n=1 Tax=Psophocarpus tetragonolobus TaxID=3891 RepID=A0AAN9XJR0_PSOTE
MIPKKFVDKYGESLPNTLCLKTPNGAEWNLNLEKCDGKIWFQKGWKEFADCHSLSHGHILLFKCETTSHFKVQVFYLSALEIDYPSKGKEGKVSSNNQGNKPPDDEKFERNRPGQKRKDNSLSKSLQTYQIRSHKHVKVDESLILLKKALHHTDIKCKEESNVIANQVTALERASSFKPCNPFCIVVMHPSYVLSNGGPLLLAKFEQMFPVDFVKKYGEGLPNTLFFKTPNGAEWRLKLEKHDGKIWFQEGWKEFADYHSLVHGHLLLFKWERTSHFQVHIFDLSAVEINYPSKRTNGELSSNNQVINLPNEENLENHIPDQNNNSSLELLQQYQMRSGESAEVENTNPYTKSKGKSKAMANQVTAFDRASSFKPCNPFFLVVMYPTYINGCSLIVWSNKCLRILVDQTRNKFILSNGWKAFSRDNNLNVDDVCIFELINRTELTFLVHIFRETNSSNCSTSQDCA